MIKRLGVIVALLALCLLGLKFLAGPAFRADMLIAGVYWQTSLPLHQALDLISPILGALAVLPLLFFCFLLVVGLLALN